MTDQTYKLVPVEPASEMLEAMNRTGLINSSDCRIVYREAIAAAPEPVCKLPSDDEIREFLATECQAGLIADIDDELLPLAREIIAKFGKKVEMVGNE